MKYASIILLFLAMLNMKSFAQDQDSDPEDNNPKARKIILPQLPGYKTLKADFHTHTIFSDGWVWPSFRVDEAVRDGLDVISLTEHMDFMKTTDSLVWDRNHSFEIATEYAKDKNILVIKGVEISPRVQPYHNNVLFVKDANLPFNYMKSSRKVFVQKENATHDELMAPFLAAQKQDAFVVYNHPGNMPTWMVHDTAVLTAFHKELLDKKILKGIEVVNSGNYNVRAHQIAMQYNLTMLCNTDEHTGTFRYKDGHRPMTLVFATEKTEAAVKEAMLAGRTALYFGDYLIARQREAEPFFKAAITAKTEKGIRKKEPILNVKLMNNSDLPFKLEVRNSNYAMEKYPLGQVVLPPHKETTIMLRGMWEYPQEVKFNIRVTNILVTAEESLSTSLTLPVNK